MAKSYNWLGAQKVNDLSIGLCPVCNRRLSAECEHRTIESEEWYALHLVAEQEAHNEKATDPYRRPFDRDDAAILAAARKVSPAAVLLGPQEPPQDYRIWNKRQPDGTFKPLSQFFDEAVQKADAALTSGDLTRMAYGEDWMTEAIAREADAKDLQQTQEWAK